MIFQKKLCVVFCVLFASVAWATSGDPEPKPQVTIFSHPIQDFQNSPPEYSPALHTFDISQKAWRLVSPHLEIFREPVTAPTLNAYFMLLQAIKKLPKNDENNFLSSVIKRNISHYYFRKYTSDDFRKGKISLDAAFKFLQSAAKKTPSLVNEELLNVRFYRAFWIHTNMDALKPGGFSTFEIINLLVESDTMIDSLNCDDFKTRKRFSTIPQLTKTAKQNTEIFFTTLAKHAK